MAKRRRNFKDSTIFPARPKSYTEYLAAEGIDYRGEYDRSLRDARLTSARERAGYGESGERLASLGLQGSGYAAHLEAVAEDRAGERLRAISEEKRQAADNARRSYADYLTDYERGQIGSAKSIRRELEATGSTNREELFLMARSLGADERHAEVIASAVYKSVKEESFNKLLPELLALGADYDTAKKLALEMGLDSEAAEELAERIKFSYNGYRGYADSYLEYLERLGSLTPYSTLTGGN